MLSSVSNAPVGTPSPAVAKEVDQLFKKVDANHDGKITKDELTRALESDSVNLGSGDPQSKVDAIFNLLDPGGKGYITKQDATEGLEKLAQRAPGGSESPEGAHRPAHHHGGGGGGGGTTVTGLDVDPADTNQDGEVSMQEELAYALKQYQQQADSNTQPQSVAYG
jgi:EF-hand domain pair/EF hand